MISVIIPTYNRANKLLRSLESVLNQTFRDIEIIVVDDGSTDDTETTVKNIKDERVRYIKHKNNMGGGVARNTGIENACGEYIAFQDSDDVWYSNKLEEEINCLMSKDADIVFCKMQKIVNGRTENIIPSNYTEGFLKSGSNVYGIGTPTLLGKAEVFKKNRFDDRLPRFQELELLMRLSAVYKIYCYDKPLMDNYFDGSSTATSGNPQKLLIASSLIHEKYPNLGRQNPDLSYRIARNLINQSYRKDVDKKMKHQMQQMATRIDHSGKLIIRYLFVKIGLLPIIKRVSSTLR